MTFTFFHKSNSDSLIKVVKRALKKTNSGLKIDDDELQKKISKSIVIYVLFSDKGVEASKILKRELKKLEKAKNKS